MVFTVSGDLRRREALSDRGVRVERLEADADGRVPLPMVMERLGGEGVLTLLTETGTGLNTALLAGGLVDRLTVFSAPLLLGAEGKPAFGRLDVPLKLGEEAEERFGEDGRRSVLLRDPWAEA